VEAQVGWSVVSCLCSLWKKKQLELSTSELIHIYFLQAVSMQWLWGQRSSHRILKYADRVALQVDTTAHLLLLCKFVLLTVVTLLCWYLDASYSLGSCCLQVVKVDESDSAMPYFVHYVGWNSHCDEWVGRDAVVGFADATATRRTSKRLVKVEILSDFVICQFWCHLLAICHPSVCTVASGIVGVIIIVGVCNHS